MTELTEPVAWGEFRSEALRRHPEAYAAARAAGLAPLALGQSLARETPEEAAERREAATAARRRRRQTGHEALLSQCHVRHQRPFEAAAQHRPALAWAGGADGGADGGTPQVAGADGGRRPVPKTNLLLQGASVGTGKSHLAWSIALSLSAGGAWVVGWSVPALADAIRPGRDEHALADAADCDVLLLDELGAEMLGERGWTLDAWFRVIDERWGNERPTIVTTNLDDGQLIDRYGARIADRLWDGATVVHLEGPTRRAVQ
jgi:DNA replication protein DnaC